MTYTGEVKNGVVVFDGGSVPPDGTKVQVVPQADPPSTIRGVSNGDAKREFEALAERWRSERPRGADVEDMVRAPAYQAVIQMGERAVKPILQQLRQRPEHWFVALHQITGENPVGPEAEGKIKQMAEAWVRWGKERRYLGDMD